MTFYIHNIKRRDKRANKLIFSISDPEPNCLDPANPSTVILITPQHTWTSWQEWAAPGESFRPARGCARDWPVLAAA